MGEAGLGAEEGAPGVDLVEEVVVLYWGVGHISQPDGAGIVDQDVNTFMFALLINFVLIYTCKIKCSWALENLVLYCMYSFC